MKKTIITAVLAAAFAASAFAEEAAEKEATWTLTDADLTLTAGGTKAPTAGATGVNINYVTSNGNKTWTMTVVFDWKELKSDISAKNTVAIGLMKDSYTGAKSYLRGLSFDTVTVQDETTTYAAYAVNHAHSDANTSWSYNSDTSIDISELAASCNGVLGLTAVMTGTALELYAYNGTSDEMVLLGNIATTSSANFNYLYIDESYLDSIKSVYVFKSAAGGPDMLAVTRAAVVPEPATATLSLLALAGLAARRRRK